MRLIPIAALLVATLSSCVSTAPAERRDISRTSRATEVAKVEPWVVMPLTSVLVMTANGPDRRPATVDQACLSQVPRLQPAATAQRASGLLSVDPEPVTAQFAITRTPDGSGKCAMSLRVLTGHDAVAVATQVDNAAPLGIVRGPRSCPTDTGPRANVWLSYSDGTVEGFRVDTSPDCGGTFGDSNEGRIVTLTGYLAN